MFQQARDLRTSRDFARMRRAIVAFAPNDAVFRARFRVAKVTKSSAAKYVLRKIEEHERGPATGETAVVSRVNLEHIFPENPRGTRLPHHDDMVDRLGNLTLLHRRINTALRNAPFREKRATYRASAFHITSALARNTGWNENSILRRQRRFAQAAARIWAFE